MIREGHPIVLQSDAGLTLRGTVLEYDGDECLSVVTNSGDEFTFRQTADGFEDARGDEWSVVRSRKNPEQAAERRVNPFEHQRNSTMAHTAADWHNERYELKLYIDNDRQLYQQKQAIEKSLTTKVKRGKYNSKLAPKAWMFLVDEGAKKYCKEFRCDVRNTFPKKFVKDPLAVEYAREWEGEYELQEGVKVNPRGKNPYEPKDVGLSDATDLFMAGLYKQALKKLNSIPPARLSVKDRTFRKHLLFSVRAKLTPSARLSRAVSGNPRGKKVSKKSLQAAMGRAKKKQSAYARAGRTGNPKVSLRSVMGKALK